MTDKFFESQEVYRSEIVILAERIHYSASSAKFKIPVLTPATKIVSESVNSSNIVNRKDISKLGFGRMNLVDYIVIPIPNFLRSTFSYDEYGYVYPGVQFLVTFVGGDITKPRLIGVY